MFLLDVFLDSGVDRLLEGRRKILNGLQVLHLLFVILDLLLHVGVNLLQLLLLLLGSTFLEQRPVYLEERVLLVHCLLELRLQHLFR